VIARCGILQSDGTLEGDYYLEYLREEKSVYSHNTFFFVLTLREITSSSYYQNIQEIIVTSLIPFAV